MVEEIAHGLPNLKQFGTLSPMPGFLGWLERQPADAWLDSELRHLLAASAGGHDGVVAAVSHLPHLLAYGLVDEIAARANAGQLFGSAAGGFRDFTRIASSHPEMWRDICVANRDALLAELDRYLAKLAELRAYLAAGDAAALERLFAGARAARNRWVNGEFEDQ